MMVSPSEPALRYPGRDSQPENEGQIVPAAPQPVPPALRHLPPAAPTRRDALVEMLSQAIAEDALPADLPLPSCRALAAAHGLSKNTVQAAYERLVELGVVRVRQRSGYLVATPVRPRREVERPAAPAGGFALPEPRPSALPRVRHPDHWRDSPFPFVYNQIDPALFPIEAWRECSRLALGRKGLPDLTADDGAGDNPNLVSQLRRRLLAHRGIHCAEDEIMVTLGTQNAIALAGLLLRALPGVIAVEDPGYPDARNAFALTGNALAPVPVDRDGLRVDLIPAGCKLVYVTPSHQFPTSVTMSAERRQALLAAAESQGFLIFEDDYEADLEPGSTLPTLRSLDRQGRVVHASSLSKSLSPGLRLGFMVAPAAIIREAKALRHALLRHAPTPVQETAALFIGLGHYDAHLRRLLREMDRRRELMAAGIRRNLPRLTVSSASGGTSFWLTGADGRDGSALAHRLAAEGVILDPGRIFYFHQDRDDALRLGFGAIRPERIEPGIRLISRVLAGNA